MITMSARRLALVKIITGVIGLLMLMIGLAFAPDTCAEDSSQAVCSVVAEDDRK